MMTRAKLLFERLISLGNFQEDCHEHGSFYVRPLNKVYQYALPFCTAAPFSYPTPDSK